MAGLLDVIIKHHQKNKIRARKFPILKASMAAAAVVAVADGDLDRREGRRARRLIKVLDSLKIYSTETGTEIFSEFVSKLQDDPEGGHAEAMATIAEVKDDPEEAAMVVLICKTISEADGVVSEAEAADIGRICKLLDVDPEAIEALDIPVIPDY